jgi:hypothetical protein
MAKKTTTEGFNVGYWCRDKNTNDDIKNVSMNWENRSVEEIRDNLNTWLVATGYSELQVVLKDQK